MPVNTSLSKLDLAKQMLLMLRDSVSCRLWVAMDRWYLCKEFFVFLMDHNFDWVTKAKRNTALYRKVKEPGRRERYLPVSARQLIKEAYKSLAAKGTTGIDGHSACRYLYEIALSYYRTKRADYREAAPCPDCRCRCHSIERR